MDDASGPRPALLDRAAVRRSFGRVAASYDRSRDIEREIAVRMAERLEYVRISPSKILDLGCGTGVSMPSLRERYRNAEVIGVDAVPAMLETGKRTSKRLRWLLPFLGTSHEHRIAADAAHLPLASRSIGLVWSNLLLPWVDSAQAAIAEMHRVLETGGLAMFSSLGPDTLKELKSCFRDSRTHVHQFADMHDIGDMLVRAGFSDPVMDMEIIKLTYATVDDLVRDLKSAGATCAAHDRVRGLLGRRAWGAMQLAYEGYRRDSRLPATLEIVYGHAWKSEPRKDDLGRAIIRFDPASPNRRRG